MRFRAMAMAGRLHLSGIPNGQLPWRPSSANPAISEHAMNIANTCRDNSGHQHGTTARPVRALAHSLVRMAGCAQPADYGGAQHAARNPACVLAHRCDRLRRSLALGIAAGS